MKNIDSDLYELTKFGYSIIIKPAKENDIRFQIRDSDGNIVIEKIAPKIEIDKTHELNLIPEGFINAAIEHFLSGIKSINNG